MVDITTIPPELWQEIVTHACTDGGPTGKSLALSCKYLHMQSFSYRFHSLALSSLAQVEAFLAFVVPFTPDWKPPVHHLWLAFLNEPSPPPEALKIRYPFLPRRSSPDMVRHFAADDARYTGAIGKLLQLVAPTLRSLYLLQNSWQPLPRLPQCRLPVLDDLTVMGSVSALLPLPPPHDAEHEPSRAAPYPALRRFHTATFAAESRAEVLAHCGALSASPLTHLRVSGVSGADATTRFARSLARALGVLLEPAERQGAGAPGASGADTSAWREGAPLARVYSVVVQGGWSYGAESREDWEAAEGHLLDLSEKMARAGVACALVLEPRLRDGAAWRRSLREEWRRRIEGGYDSWDDEAWVHPEVLGTGGFDRRQEQLALCG